MSARALADFNPEPNLIIQARNGNVEAFAELYETHKPRIHAVCLRMTNNVAEAEDLAQDAFIYVFRKISTFRGDSAFSTWIHRVTVNTVLMHFRRKGKRQVSLEHPQDSDGPTPEYGRVDEKLAACADRLVLIKAIEELPPGYRTIFLLHEVQGYEHKEIARLLHCTIGNSKSQLHKARLRLRELLTARGYTYRQKRAAVARPAELDAQGPVEVAHIKGLVLSRDDVSPGITIQFPETEGNEGKAYVPKRPSGNASAAYKKQLTSDKKQLTYRQNLAGLSLVSKPKTMLPAIGQDDPALLAETGS